MRKPISFLAMTFGVLAVFASFLLAALLAVAGFQGASRSAAAALQVELVAGSVLLLGVGFGLLLAWAGWRAFSGVPAQPLRLTSWGWLGLALGTVLLLGQAIFDAHVLVFLPFFHVAAAVLPALLFISLAAWAARHRGEYVERRAIGASLAWGGLGASLLAAIFETLLALAMLVVAFFWFQAVDPTILARLEDLARNAGQGGQPPDLTSLAPLLRSPLVILGVLALLGLGAPLIEEACKALAVPFVALSGHRLSQLDGYMFGLAAGAGFAVFEGSLYGALGVQLSGDWASVMLLRAGTTAIHCFASGMGGLGWQAILVERRWARGLGLGVLAVAIHGTWNVLAAAQGFVSLVSTGGLGGASATALMALVLGLMGLLWLVIVAGIPWVAERVAGRAAAPAFALPEAASGEALDTAWPDGDEEQEAPADAVLLPQVPPDDGLDH